ncbi:MAG: hypothetical protein R6U20_11310, partial [Longimonas sp.]|uniref:hypothetical protein n=1 Tax=Longimonas sp. TaxID=2039626 RepID=UPI003977005A
GRTVPYLRMLNEIDDESLRAQRNQWGIAVSFRSGSDSGEIPLPTAVDIGMTRWGRVISIL